ncbi:hypothetical protein E2C01_031447 [Portunus trituberculatus]|uniref:Uncharacterized protein n=1 Tax=Portunus trituberculatus TaxID=210409 RepID=A0A5B7ETG0_PORTR|nr:hypothetical protein [Portunus trituberculatus]
MWRLETRLTHTVNTDGVAGPSNTGGSVNSMYWYGGDGCRLVIPKVSRTSSLPLKGAFPQHCSAGKVTPHSCGCRLGGINYPSPGWVGLGQEDNLSQGDHRTRRFER